MRFPATCRRATRRLCQGGLLLALAIATGCGPKAAPPAPAKPKADAAKANGVPVAQASADQYTSVFEDLPSPQGRDPFFPNSHRRDPVAPVASSGTGYANSSLVLKAIVHSRHSQAVINNAILDVGEQGAVRVPNGKVQVQCLEIGADYVIVRVEGEAETKRLMMEQKK